MSLVLGGLDVVGDGDEDTAEGLVTMGARRGVRIATPRWMRGTTSQGVSRPQEELDFLPFEALTLSDTQLTGSLEAQPQRPFRGERFILNAFSATIANAADAVVIDPAIFVGAVQVGAAQGATPISAFAAGAFGVRLSVPPAGQGTIIRIFVRALAIPVGESIQVVATLIGRTMR
jgi:hypothetical protein